MTRPSVIVSVDPGLTSGVALYDFSAGEMRSGEVEGRHNLYDWVADTVSGHSSPVFVVERFTINEDTAKKSRQMDAVYAVGYLDGLCYRNHWPITLQSPAKAKAFATNEKLRAVDWWHPTPGNHNADACRHLYTFCCENYRKPGQIGFDLLNRTIEGLDLA